ncbi:Glucuronoyl esterase catalytic domain from Hypocrea Jecorina [Clohesyomyces aquaticus]|uniref:(4-O-methyl)-D-glucuronate--lignin esterase n=1 Tax=Clohesyomyces aquaticus TaxID=1231657 RepID=A0A1Y1ZB88_9PLEO|nr:Glucuronoyl esterase catalytic domain from Hypocrea Jecorina [Clohesyomyces aquaticus]
MLNLLLSLLFTAPGLGQASTCPNLPAAINYATNPKLPDPFLPLSGTRLSKKDQWPCRKEEIRQLFQRYSYGTFPPKPEAVTAAMSGNALKITVSEGSKSMSFSVNIKLPSSGVAPYPAIIAYGGASLPIPNTVATITYQNFEMAADNGRGKGKFYDFYGSNHNAGGMIAAAWGVDRIIDALEMTPAAKIDPKRVGVTGCSRNGKGSMIAGAFVDRIALALPQEGGQSAAGCWRIADEIQKNGTKVETAHQIVNGDSWFSTDFPKYVDMVPTLPWDNHMLHALYAYPPRGLLIIENTAIDYLGPTSNYHCASAGRKVHEALGVKDYFGFSQNSHSDHCGFPKAQQPELTAFIERFLLAKDTKTDVWKTDGKFTIDETRWIDWAVPSLS